MRLSITHWPFWLKVSAAFTALLLIPAIVLVALGQGIFTQVVTQSVTAYLQERGQTVAQRISQQLQQSSDQLNAFVRDTTVYPFLTASVAHTADERQAVAVRRVQEMLNLSAGFKQLALYDQNSDFTWLISERQFRNNPSAGAFKQGYADFMAAAAVSDQIFGALIDSQTNRVELLQALIDRTGSVVGLLVAPLDQNTVFLNNLSSADSLYANHSYLVAAGNPPVIIADDETRNQVSALAPSSPAIERGLSGNTALETYTLSDGKDRTTEVQGYYAPIYAPHNDNVPLFSLIIETSNNETTARVFAQYFNGTRWFPLSVGLFVFAALMALLLTQLVVPPLTSLRHAIQSLSQGDFTTPLPAAERRDELGQTSAAFLDMRSQVKTLMAALETRVADRARDIVATQEISRYAAKERNLQALLNRVVELIREQFPSIYHAQIFLIDDEGVYAVLRSSTGEPGQKLLARGHRLAVGSVSVIGQVTSQREAVIARDTATSQVHRKNEFLPDTRAELAIPLIVGETLIGALDVQSRSRNAFPEDEVSVLRTMADQIAVAIENARLYQESLRRLDEIEQDNRRATFRSWRDYTYSLRVGQIQTEAGKRNDARPTLLRQQAIERGQLVVGSVTNNQTVPIAVPIILRGQILGAVEWEMRAQEMDENKLQLAQELANRLAVNLENVRLLEESRRAAERERVVNTIAAKLTPQTEIEDILQVAVREVGQALRSPYVNIRLSQAEGHNASSNNG